MKILVYLQNESLRKEAITALRESAVQTPFEENETGWPGLLEQLEKKKPEALLLDLTNAPADLPAAIRQIKTHSPRSKVIGVYTAEDPQMILAAMRAGVNEFLSPPLRDSLPAAIEQVRNTVESDVSKPVYGKVLAFLSAKGGCGATTVACHVAADLQTQTHQRVLLADFDLNSGLVGFLMKAQSSYSVLDAAKNLSRLDESLWKALVVETRPKLSVMPAPASYALSDYLQESQFAAVLQFMRTQHEWIVLDLGRSLNPIVTAVLETIDQLFVVSTYEVIALHGLKTIINGLSNQGEKLQIILNRTPKTTDVSTQELEKILGRSIYATLPNDYAGLYQAYSSGNLLDANSRLAQYLAALTTRIAGLAPAKAKKKFALFG